MCACALCVFVQTRQWNKELEARPADLHTFARLKQRQLMMESQKGELYKVGCNVDLNTVCLLRFCKASAFSRLRSKQ